MEWRKIKWGCQNKNCMFAMSSLTLHSVCTSYIYVNSAGFVANISGTTLREKNALRKQPDIKYNKANIFENISFVFINEFREKRALFFATFNRCALIIYYCATFKGDKVFRSNATALYICITKVVAWFVSRDLLLWWIGWESHFKTY